MLLRHHIKPHCLKNRSPQVVRGPVNASPKTRMAAVASGPSDVFVLDFDGVLVGGWVTAQSQEEGRSCALRMVEGRGGSKTLPAMILLAGSSLTAGHTSWRPQYSAGFCWTRLHQDMGRRASSVTPGVRTPTLGRAGVVPPHNPAQIDVSLELVVGTPDAGQAGCVSGSATMWSPPPSCSTPGDC